LIFLKPWIKGYTYTLPLPMTSRVPKSVNMGLILTHFGTIVVTSLAHGFKINSFWDHSNLTCTMGLILTHFGTIVTSLAHDNQATTQFMQQVWIQGGKRSISNQC
jgi:hypothetical protein